MQVGQWVEIRSKAEILRTLDKSGRLEGMPFMPQMFEYCGKRFQVYKSAHKACDHVYTGSCRRLSASVHLDLRCDGQAYGGCQHKCLLYWKEAWLRPVEPALVDAPVEEAQRAEPPANRQTCLEEDVWKGTRRNGILSEPNDDTQFRCQGTELNQFTTPLRWWDPTQYAQDLASGNATLQEMLRGGIYVLFGRRFGTRLPFLPKLYNLFQKLTGGMPTPVRRGLIPLGQPQPTVSLNLQPGELVRVKSHDEILKTLDGRNFNRGMGFDAEMVPFCGGTYRVLARVERFIDERTGRIKSLRTPAVVLQHATCGSRFSRCRMFCPRGIYAWWREIWLERVAEPNDCGSAQIARDVPRRRAGIKPLEKV